jgi:hypothetical protein
VPSKNGFSWLGFWFGASVSNFLGGGLFAIAAAMFAFGKEHNLLLAGVFLALACNEIVYGFALRKRGE